MPSDKEYLAEAGLDTETGGPIQETTEASPATVSTPDASPESAPATAAAPTPAKPVEMFEINGQKYPVSTEFQLTHGGKILKVPYQNMANTYRQWQHLQDKWNTEYKPKISEYEEKLPQYQKAQEFYDKYGALQDWSEKNPDEWSSLFDYWQNRNQHLLAAKMGAAPAVPGQEGAAPQMPHMQPLIEKIAALEKKIEEDGQRYGKYVEKYESAEKTRQETQDVEFVKKEIQDFQSEYPEMNLEERDPDGVALWAKIVQYGLEKGYTEFEPAARVFLKQRIADVYATRARTEARGSVKQDKMNGVVKRSATPFNKGQEPVAKQGDVRKKSYGDLAEEARAELLAMSGT